MKDVLKSPLTPSSLSNQWVICNGMNRLHPPRFSCALLHLLRRCNEIKYQEAVIKWVGGRRWKRNKGPRKSTNQITLCLTERVGYEAISRAQVSIDLGLSSLRHRHSGLPMSPACPWHSQSTIEVDPLPPSWLASVSPCCARQILGQALGIHSIHLFLLWSLQKDSAEW